MTDPNTLQAQLDDEQFDRLEALLDDPALALSLPPILVAAVVGTLFSLFQALTQIQEQTLQYALKFFAIVLTTGEVSIPAVIGFISLFGIATRNGMLLITEYKRLRTEEHKTIRDAIIEGSLSRLNPILMTALTSALALVPLVLGGDLPGNEIHDAARQASLS